MAVTKISIRIGSFNCWSLKSSVVDISKCCNLIDLLVLQGTWLRPEEVRIIIRLNVDFHGIGWSVMKNNIKLCGRPFGDLGIIWRKSLGNTKFKVVLAKDRFCVSKFKLNDVKFYIVNVYMPCGSNVIEKVVEYNEVVGDIKYALDCVCGKAVKVIILGDFNASVDNGKLQVWKDFCEDKYFVMVDTRMLSEGTYTYESGDSRRSWIDHILVSNNLVRSVKSCNVYYEHVCSDHFVINCAIEFDSCGVGIDATNIVESRLINSVLKVRWDRLSEADVKMYKQRVDYYLRKVAVSVCCVSILEGHAFNVCGCLKMVDDNHLKCVTFITLASKMLSFKPALIVFQVLCKKISKFLIRSLGGMIMRLTCIKLLGMLILRGI